MRYVRALSLAGFLLCVYLLISPTLGQDAAAVITRPGDPLPGLRPADLNLFRLGHEDFSEIEEESEGLGPAFNGLGCASCHNVPAVGGFGPMVELRAGRLSNGQFTEPPGGSLVHMFSIPDFSCQPTVPAMANTMARRLSIPLFGAGLVEAIPDGLIRALEDPSDRDGDGISGRAAVITDVATGQRRVGRFGWKAQQATLLAFSGDAYLNEMGITNDLFPREVGSGISADRLAACDKVPDPEDSRDPATGLRGVDLFEGFMKFLAPVRQAAMSDQARRGAVVFATVGCVKCHVPALVTGSNSNPALDRKPVPLYSDLLLHDIGTGDGIAQAAANPNEIRTPSLWGLRFRTLLLHDGSVPTPDQAIGRHGGEAEGVRRRYQALQPDEKANMLAFLATL
jgi:CxxC motif-containing protein (DUF1111 family)